MRIALSICALLGFAISNAPSALSQDENYQALIRRLEAAESTIRQLQEQQQAATLIPPAQQVSPPSQVAPVSLGRASYSADESISSLSAAWDEKWKAQEETNDELAASIKRSVQSGGSGTRSMKISGRIHVDYWGFPDSSPGINEIESGDPANTPQDRTGFRRMRLAASGDLHPNVGYKLELEMAGANSSEFRDVYLSFKDASFFQTILIGNHKRPYGLDHLNSSRFNVFIERPFVIESFNQDARRLGISTNGITDDESWNWRVGVWQQRLIQDEGNYVGDHLQGEIAGRLANTWWYDETSGGRGYGHWAIAGTIAAPDGKAGGDPMDLGSEQSQNEARFRHRPEARTDKRWLDTGRIDGASWYELIGFEKVLNVGPLQLVGEYQTIFMQRDSRFNDLMLHGGYVYAAYMLTGEHVPWVRDRGTIGRVKPFENFFLVDRCCGGHGTGWGAWQVAARYSYADFNNEDIAGGVGNSVTLGLVWYMNANTHLQFNYINGNIDNMGAGQLGGDYDIIGARFRIDF